MNYLSNLEGDVNYLLIESDGPCLYNYNISGKHLTVDENLLSGLISAQIKMGKKLDFNQEKISFKWKSKNRFSHFRIYSGKASHGILVINNNYKIKHMGNKMLDEMNNNIVDYFEKNYKDEFKDYKKSGFIKIKDFDKHILEQLISAKEKVHSYYLMEILNNCMSEGVKKKRMKKIKSSYVFQKKNSSLNNRIEKNILLEDVIKKTSYKRFRGKKLRRIINNVKEEYKGTLKLFKIIS